MGTLCTLLQHQTRVRKGQNKRRAHMGQCVVGEESLGTHDLSLGFLDGAEGTARVGGVVAVRIRKQG